MRFHLERQRLCLLLTDIVEFFFIVYGSKPLSLANIKIACEWLELMGVHDVQPSNMSEHGVNMCPQRHSMSGLNTAINTFGSYWSPCDLRHASPRISATTAPMTCASQVQRPHMALALKALKPWRPSRSSYCFRYIYILMVVDVY